MKKRLLCVLLALVLVLSLTACGEKKEEPAQEPEQAETVETPETEAPEETPAETEEEPVQEEEPAEPAQEPENKPAETPAEKPAVPTQKPAVPAEKPAEKPTETAESKSVDLAAFYETVASGDNMPALMQLEGEMLEALYPGLSAIKTKQCGAYTAMISAAVGEIALVEVQSASDVQAVKDIFQARIDYQVGDDQNPGGAWYPASIEGWKNGSRIVSNGNYIMLVALSEGADTVVNSFNALFA